MELHKTLTPLLLGASALALTALSHAQNAQQNNPSDNAPSGAGMQSQDSSAAGDKPTAGGAGKQDRRDSGDKRHYSKDQPATKGKRDVSTSPHAGRNRGEMSPEMGGVEGGDPTGVEPSAGQVKRAKKAATDPGRPQGSSGPTSDSNPGANR